MGHCADCGCPIESVYPLCLDCGFKESGEMDARDQCVEDALDTLKEMSNDDDEGGDDENADDAD